MTLFSPFCFNLITSSNRDCGDFRWGPQWGLGMGVYVGPCFQGREPSRGSAFLTQSTTKGMWTIWTKPLATIALHRAVHVVRWPASPLTLSAFSFPLALEAWSKISIGSNGPAITSTVRLCVLWFLPPGSARVNRVICEAHCGATQLCGCKECCLRSTYHQLKGQWDDCCLISLFYRHATSSYDSQKGIHTSHECTSDKWNACSPLSLITKYCFQLI